MKLALIESNLTLFYTITYLIFFFEIIENRVKYRYQIFNLGDEHLPFPFLWYIHRKRFLEVIGHF